MKIVFKVTNLFTQTNNTTKEEFVKLQLVKEITKDINGCKTKAKLVAYHNVQSTTLSVGDDFVYDDTNYEMVNQQYKSEDDVIKNQKVIYLKAE